MTNSLLPEGAKETGKELGKKGASVSKEKLEEEYGVKGWHLALVFGAGFYLGNKL